ncbi:MAG TPA: septation protein A [Rhizomicrobium sp.]|jgi:intracellular septation protein
MSTAPAHRKIGPLQRLGLDLGPLLIFFVSFQLAGIFAATAAFMVAILLALAVGYAIERRVSPMPLFTALLVLIFGGLTLYLKNDTFIKMKPTVLYAGFGLTLLGGLLFGRLFVKYVFAAAFELTEEGWRKLTFRWGWFFLALAILNEIVWRSMPTATWVKFKVFGIIPLIMLFALAQMPLVLKHEVKQNSDT